MTSDPDTGLTVVAATENLSAVRTAPATRRRSWVPNRTGLAAVVLVVGTAVRLLVTLRGHNFDVDSYWIVGDIVHRGGNVYNETPRYNYGPVWSLVIGALHRITVGVGLGFFWFRFSVASFLTLVDIAMAAVLARRFGPLVAALFFLNPVSIFITGYHSQFDNLAVLLGLLAAIVLSDHSRRPGISRSEVGGLALLGLSLSVKHILVLLPLWIAFRKPDLRSRLVVLITPPALFLLSFAPYWPSAHEGIVEHVFRYRSYENSPLLSFLFGHHVGWTAAATFLLLALIIAGWISRRRPLEEAMLIYTLVTVAAAPAVVNQYLAICIPAIAVFFNLPFVLYTVYAGVYLLQDAEGLHYPAVARAFEWMRGDRAHQHLTASLAVGIVWLGAARFAGRPRRKLGFLPNASTSPRRPRRS